MRKHLDGARSRKPFSKAMIVAAALAICWFGALPCAAQPKSGVTNVLLVVCAPGYPGSTVEAQPAMDALAEAITTAAGWKGGECAAVYFETEKAGLARLAKPDATLALVPLPFWLKHHSTLKLVPHLQAVQQGGEATESWSLVAAKGAVTSPLSLSGFELLSLAGNAPRFIRGPVLGPWGGLPENVNIVFSGAVLSGLRRAANGEKVALLLDSAQAASLPTLPLAQKLEVVTRSSLLPVSVFCVVGDRLPAAKLKVLLKALSELGSTPASSEALAGVRLARFVPADQKLLESIREVYERTK